MIPSLTYPLRQYMSRLNVSSWVPYFIQGLTVNTSIANDKSMVYVQSIMACWSRFACPDCLWDCCLNTSLDAPESSQCTTDYAPY